VVREAGILALATLHCRSALAREESSRRSKSVVITGVSAGKRAPTDGPSSFPMQFPFGLRLFYDLIVVDGSVMSFPDG
jgi:hypothetical protein